MKNLQSAGILILLLFSSLITFSQTHIWDGDSDGDGDGLKWEDPLNWNIDQVPGKGSIVEIGSDSVVVQKETEIQQLILESGGILYVSETEDFVVENSTGEGVTINGGAKFYVNGTVIIINSAANGIDLQVNADLIVENSAGLLQVIGTASDGILGGIGATFTNYGQIYMDQIGAEGLDLRHFINHGEIVIEDAGIQSAKLSGLIGFNDGSLDFDDGLTVQLSSTFDNAPSGVIKTRKLFNVLCSFLNQGKIDIRNSQGTSLSITNETFTNENEMLLRTSSAATISLVNGAILENTEDGEIKVFPTSVNGAGQYLIEMDGPATSIYNVGLIDIDLGQKMNGIFIENRSVIENYGDIYLDNYIDKGVFVDPLGVNTEVIQNYDTAYFAIGTGQSAAAVAFQFNSKVRVLNDSCATLVFKDSLAIQGVSGMKLENYGFLEVESFSKKSNATFENEGAVYIADTSLAFTPNPSLIALISNTGLVYHPIAGPIQENVALNPVFAAINSNNTYFFFNQIWIENHGVGQSHLEAGSLNTSTNTWTPNFRADGADSLTLFYRHSDGPCEGEYFTLDLPVVTQGCSPITYTFNQSVDIEWNRAANWTPEGIPTSCDHVIIPAGKQCLLSTSHGLGGLGNAKTILVEQGAVFEANDTAVLTVDPNN